MICVWLKMQVKGKDAFTWQLESTPGASVGAKVPRSRCKHAACICDSCVYIYGGRNGNIPLKDFWKFDLKSKSWECLSWTGDNLPNLQEHTMVPYQNKIYIFGGNFQFGADLEIPFWVLDLDTMVCKRLNGNSPFPKGRRGHSAVIYQSAMYIFAGFIDMRCASNELWSFSFDTRTWCLLKAADGSSVGGRHGHSAVVHGHFMWVYGGLANLQTKDELWCWDFSTERWTRIRAGPGPPPLEGHTACTLYNLMLIYGGSHDGVLHNDLWAFDFAVGIWTKVICNGGEPNPCTQHTAVLAFHEDWCSDSLCVASISRHHRNINCLSSSSSANQGTDRHEDVDSRKLKDVEMKVLHDSCDNELLTMTAEKSKLHNKTTVSSADVDMCNSCDPQDVIPSSSENKSGLSSRKIIDDTTQPTKSVGCHVFTNGDHSRFENVNVPSHEPHLSVVGNHKKLEKPGLSLCNSTHALMSPGVSAASDSPSNGRTQHILAVRLLGESGESPAVICKSTDHSKHQSVHEDDKCKWVEMEMFQKENCSSSRENLILQDLDDGDVTSAVNASFNYQNEEFLQQSEEVRKQEITRGVKPRLSCPDHKRPSVKEEWTNTTDRLHSGVQTSKNGVTSDVVIQKNRSNSLTMLKNSACQKELLSTKSCHKLFPQTTSTCPEYCMMVFGGRSSCEAPNLVIRSISVARLEIKFDD